MPKKTDLSPAAYERQKQLARKWWQKYGPTTGRRYADDRRLRRYGITHAMYNALLLLQEYRCAICRGKQQGGKRNLSIDHDRRCCPGLGSCGKCVRGLLCISCNARLGTIETFTEQAEAYLADLPIRRVEGAA